MKIIPSEKNFKNWAAIPPTDGDLLFLQERDLPLASAIEFPLYTSDEVRSQALSLWTLNKRSWYLYALNRASHCIWLPVGALESWHELPRTWFKQNKIEKYSSVELNRLTEVARIELRRVGLASILNQYLDSSGPNCFGAVASAMSGCGSAGARQWLHWKPLERFLIDQHYHAVKTNSPIATDALIFRRKADVVHAAYFIGGGYYFEMPGQDFYEPYRVEKFENWSRAWPDSKLTIFRKTHGCRGARTACS